MALILQNFSSALTTAAIGVGDTSITVGSVAKLPTLAAGDYFYAVITSAVDLNQREIVKVTAISGTTLTVTRAQENTTALAFPVGSLLEQRATSATIIDTIRAHKGNYNGIMALGSSITLTKDHIGKLIAIGGGNTITLPLVDTLQMGDTLTLIASDGDGVVNCVGSDYFYINNVTKPTSITLKLGETLTLTKWGSLGVWLVQGTALLKYQTQFGSNLNSNGYQKLPSGLIIQWGSVIATVAGTAITFPIAFPNGFFKIIMGNNNGSAASYGVSSGPATLTGSTAYASSGSVNGNYLALGY